MAVVMRMQEARRAGRNDEKCRDYQAGNCTTHEFTQTKSTLHQRCNALYLHNGGIATNR